MYNITNGSFYFFRDGHGIRMERRLDGVFFMKNAFYRPDESDMWTNCSIENAWDGVWVGYRYYLVLGLLGLVSNLLA